MIFDTHCHLDQGPGDPFQTARRAASEQVSRLLTVGIDLHSSRRAQATSRNFAAAGSPRIHYSAGLHPNSAAVFDTEWEPLTALCREMDCVAIGETGLDYHWDEATPAQQKRSFAAHLELAKELGKPVIVHTRDAFADTIEILAAHAPGAAVIHCFAGGVDEARRALDLGCYVSFAGPLTYPKAEDLRAAAAFVPADRILVETDAPFLPPQPRRGATNEPAFIVHTLTHLAAIRGLDFAAAAAMTTSNGRRLFGV